MNEDRKINVKTDFDMALKTYQASLSEKFAKAMNEFERENNDLKWILKNKEKYIEDLIETHSVLEENYKNLKKELEELREKNVNNCAVIIKNEPAEPSEIIKRAQNAFQNGNSNGQRRNVNSQSSNLDTSQMSSEGAEDTEDTEDTENPDDTDSEDNQTDSEEWSTSKFQSSIMNF